MGGNTQANFDELIRLNEGFIYFDAQNEAPNDITFGVLYTKSDGNLYWKPSNSDSESNLVNGGSESGDITGVDLTGDNGISITSENNTESGDYSATINMDISGLSALGGASLSQTDLFVIDDGPGTIKKVTFGNLEDSIFGNISGDATIASGGVLTISNTSVTDSMLAGSISNAKLTNSSVSFGGVEVSLGANDSTPAFDLSDATNYPTSSLSGTITNAQLAGSISNAKLTNSSVSFGGVEVSLGASDSTPAFDLSDATNYPTSSLSGTITNAQLAGSISNAKLASSSLTITAGNAITGGGSVSLGGSIQLDVGVDDSSIEIDSDSLRVKAGGVTNDMLAGSIANDKLSSGELQALGGLTSGSNKIPIFSGSETASLIDFLDENEMTSNSSSAVPTQSSVKSYVDSVAEGLHVKEACKVATTTNLTATSVTNTTITFSNGEGGFDATADTFTVDGVTITSSSVGERILIKDGINNDKAYNGIYDIGSLSNSTFILTRSSDMDTAIEIEPGDFTFITEGTINSNHGFVMTQTDSITLGTTDITWSQFSGAGQITDGNGLSKTGNTMSLDLKSNGGAVFEGSQLAIDLSASSITGTLSVGDGGTGQTNFTDGQLLIGNTTGNTLSKATLTAGSNINITNGNGSIEISSTYTNTQLSNEQVQDIAGPLVATGGTKTGITVTYDDTNGDMDFVVSDTTVAGDTGSTAITPGDTLTIAGGTNVTTSMSGDTLTITSTDTNTQLSDEQVQDIVGDMVSGNTETNISVTYDDTTGKLNFSSTDTQLSNEQVQDIAGQLITVNGSKTGITVTYDDANGDMDFVVSDTTVAGDTGSTAITPGDTLTIAGGTNVTTSMSGDTLTITSTDTNTQLSDEQVQDIVGGMVSGNTETNISVTYDDTTGKLNFSSTDTQLSNEQVQDIAGQLITVNGSKSGITISYDDVGGTMDFSVSDTTVAGDTGSTAITPGDTLTIAGGTNVTTSMSGDTLTITSTDTNTTYSAGGGLDLVSTTFSVDVSDFMANGVNNRILTATGADAMNAEANLTFDGSDLTVTGNILPGSDETYNLGSSSRKFSELYLSGSTIHLGDTDVKTNEDGNIEFIEHSTSNPRKLMVDELIIGSGANRVSLMKGSSNELRVMKRDTNGRGTAQTNILYVQEGGTGQSTFTDGQLLIGNTSGNTLSRANLTAGSNISITNGNGSIEIATTHSVGDGGLSQKNFTSSLKNKLDSITDNGVIDWTSSGAGTIHTTNYTNDMGSGFILEDGDGTEVTITESKEVKFVEGTGIDINWTNTIGGGDSTPYSMTFTCNLEGTELKSTGVTGTSKYLRVDGDGSCSWQSVPSYTLQAATSNSLGGIKVGTNLSIDGNGVLSSTDTNTTYTAGNGIDLTGTEFSVGASNGLSRNSSGLEVSSSQTTISSIYNTSLSVGRSSTQYINFGSSSAIRYILDNSGVANVKYSMDLNALFVQTGTADLGKSTNRWSNVYLAEDSAINYDGGMALTHNGSGSTLNLTGASSGGFTCDGDITAFKSSDKRLKDNIVRIGNPIEKIKKIGGYNFEWNELGEENTINKGKDIGLIAQEVEEVLPEATTTRDNGYKAVQYEKIVPLLIESIKEQQKMIEKLQGQVNELKNKII